MEITLRTDVLNVLTYRGVLAYVAAQALGDGQWTTAQLAQCVSCNSSLMLEGMGELHATVPALVGKQVKMKWPIGTGVASEESVQILDLKAMRRTALLDDIKKIMEWATKLPFTMGSYDGIAVARFLKTHSKVTQEEWRLALKHRFTSEGIVPGQPLHVWLDRLMEYLPGRQDKYGKLMPNGVGGKVGETLAREQSNSEARQRAVAAAGANV